MEKKIFVAALVAMTAFMTAAQCRVIAHRGYWKTDGSAQNSVRSLAKADSVGAYGSEFDVWLNDDNRLVLNHNAAYNGVVIETSRAAQIDTLVLANGEKMPYLDDYLAEARRHPELRLVLELKPMQDKQKEYRAAGIVRDMLDRYGVRGRTDIISFSFDACRAMVDSIPGARVYFLGSTKTPDECHEAGLAGIDFSQKCLREHPDYISRAHALGMKVNVWTVNKPDDIRYWIEQGVDFITTDNPEEALAIVADSSCGSAGNRNDESFGRIISTR